MRHETATDFEAIAFAKIVISQNRCKLQNLIECRIRARRFCIEEYKRHLIALSSRVALRPFALGHMLIVDATRPRKGYAPGECIRRKQTWLAEW